LLFALCPLPIHEKLHKKAKAPLYQQGLFYN
jgi:hypothetical protein